MNLKWIGAIVIVLSCGSVGFHMATEHIRQESALRQLIAVLDYFECELSYRMTALPALCGQAGKLGKGIVYKLFLNISEEMENQISPDALHCISAAIARTERIPHSVHQLLQQLARGMGRFDLDGQLQVIRAVREESNRSLKSYLNNRDSRLRNYQTLGLCAGAAIVILFI